MAVAKFTPALLIAEPRNSRKSARIAARRLSIEGLDPPLQIAWTILAFQENRRELFHLTQNGNLHIGVYPPLGRVRVAAPRRLDDEHVRLAVIQRLPWIKERREQLRSAERQSEREMVTGESHYVWGVRRRMKVIERQGRAHFEVDSERLLLYVPAGTTAERRRELLDRWYREQLRQAIPPLIAKWEPILKVSVPRWTIRRMKTKWGSCNRETGHIWLNVELAKKHPDCLEYIVVHEMTHHLERKHGPRFTKLMDRFIPNLRSLRDQLNNAPLAQESWE